MPASPLVSVEKYLNTSYHPDCDYVDGREIFHTPPFLAIEVLE